MLKLRKLIYSTITLKSTPITWRRVWLSTSRKSTRLWRTNRSDVGPIWKQRKPFECRNQSCGSSFMSVKSFIYSYLSNVLNVRWNSPAPLPEGRLKKQWRLGHQHDHLPRLLPASPAFPRQSLRTWLVGHFSVFGKGFVPTFSEKAIEWNRNGKEKTEKCHTSHLRRFCWRNAGDAGRSLCVGRWSCWEY